MLGRKNGQCGDNKQHTRWWQEPMQHGALKTRNTSFELHSFLKDDIVVIEVDSFFEWCITTRNRYAGTVYMYYY